MILFINPLNNFLTKSSKTAKLVYFGVQLIPTPESNKSLQVSSLYYSRLLSFIKHYIDEAITEMETSETTPQTEQIAEPYSSETEIARLNEAVDRQTTQSAPKTSSSSFSKIETDGVKPVETEATPQQPANNNTETVETGETEATQTEDIEDWPVSDDVKPTDNNNSVLSVDNAIAILLECQTKLQLMSKKKDIGEQLVQKAWDEMSLIQKNYLQLISLRENVTKPMGTLGYQLAYQPAPDSPIRKARLIGFYLHGEKLPQADERAVLINGETQPTICSKTHLRPLKNSKPATETEIKQLEKLLTEPQEDEPTAETIAANTFTGLAFPKQETETSPTKPDITDTVLKYISKIDSSLRWAFHTDNENIITIYKGTTEFEEINCTEATATNTIADMMYQDYGFALRPFLKDVRNNQQINLDNYYTKEEKAPAKKHQNGSKNGKQPDSEPLKSEPDKITTTDYIAKIGDIVKITASKHLSDFSGKVVEVEKSDVLGNITFTFNSKTGYEQKGGYELVTAASPKN